MKRIFVLALFSLYVFTGCMDDGRPRREYRSSQYEQGYEDGKLRVMDYPEDYELYTREDAVEMVRDCPNDFDLYDEEDMQEAYERGREEMLEEILDNPEEYGLCADETW